MKTDLIQFYDLTCEGFVELSRVKQVKKHKRPRINKKWRKRYGFISESFRLSLEDYQPKLFREYTKRFLAHGIATPKTPVVKFAFPPPPLLFIDANPPTAAIPITTETLELKMFEYVIEFKSINDLTNLEKNLSVKLYEAIEKQNLNLTVSNDFDDGFTKISQDSENYRL